MVAKPVYPHSGVDIVVGMGQRFATLEVKGFSDRLSKDSSAHECKFKKSVGTESGVLKFEKLSRQAADFAICHEKHSNVFYVVLFNELPESMVLSVPWFDSKAAQISRWNMFRNNWDLIIKFLDGSPSG